MKCFRCDEPGPEHTEACYQREKEIKLEAKRKQYREWIDKTFDKENPFGMCGDWTLKMRLAFPELERIRGTVMLSNLWERDHWWLVDPDGEIVDPTAHQFHQDYFGKAKIIYYQPRDESQPAPTGLCANCGEYIYNDFDSTVCSDKCHRAYVAYCMGG